MPECCSDPSAMWLDDFEDKQPLTTRYVSVIANALVIAGAGINGSQGVRSTSAPFLGQFETPSLLALQNQSVGMGQLPCIDPLAFGGGGYWKFNNFEPNGFYFMEFRRGVSFLLSFSVEESDAQGSGNFPLDIVVFDVSVTEIYRAKRVITNATDFFKIDIEGRFSSAIFSNPGLSYSADGFFSINVDGTEVICVKSAPDLRTASDTLSWDKVAIGLMGDFDCLYITAGWKCGTGPFQPDNPTARDTWEPTGSGPGSPGSCAPMTNPEIGDRSCPVVIPPGGATPPDYTRTLGGGIGPTAADPTDPQTMTGIVTPLAFMELTLPDATVLRLAQKTLSTPAAKVRQGRVLTYSPISQVMSDWHGRLTEQSISIEFEDMDNVFRGYMADEVNDALRNQPVTVWLESDVSRRAATAPLKMASLIVRNVTVGANHTFRLECTDELSSTESPTSLNRPVPSVIVGEIFPEAAPEVHSLPVPFYFGEYGDEDKWGENPKRTPIGIVPVIGPLDQNMVHVGGADPTWWRYLICAYASKEVVAVFASNLSESALGAVRMDGEGTSRESGEFLIPGQTGWNALFSNTYEDITAPDGTVYRLTTIYARGTRADHHNNGSVRMAVNLKGIEATGDGTGTMIDEAPEVEYFFLNFIAFQTVTSGNWPAVPTDVTGTAKTNRASVVSAKARQATWGPDGVRVAWAVRERKPISSYLAELQFGTGLRIWHDRHQIGLHVMDEVPSFSGLQTFKDHDIIDGSFQIDLAADEVITKLKYVHGPEAASGRFSSPLTVMDNQLAVAHLGGEHDAPDVEIHPVRRDDVAELVMSRFMMRFSTTPVFGSLETDLRGVDLAHGQLILVTNRLGLGTSGWVARVLQVVGIDAMVGAGEGLDGMKSLVRWEDVHDLLVLKGSTLESAFWGLMDTEATGNLMGLEGTAGVYCMGSTGL